MRLTRGLWVKRFRCFTIYKKIAEPLPLGASFIHIHFSESPGRVCCEITNSYHPKNQTDKSGSGIGLEQVRKRLELTYPGQYEWTQGVSDDGKEYKSILSLFNIQHYESNLCHSR